MLEGRAGCRLLLGEKIPESLRGFTLFAEAPLGSGGFERDVLRETRTQARCEQPLHFSIGDAGVSGRGREEFSSKQFLV